MKILYDSLGFLEPQGGVSRYFTELIRHLPPGVRWEIAADETYNAFLREPPFSVPEARHSIRAFWSGFHFRGKSIVYRTLARLGVYPSMELANERRFAAALKKGDFDVLHLTGPHGCGTAWREYAGSAKVVMTVHDLIPDMWWKDFRGDRVRRQRRYDVEHVDVIIAVSENTKRDLMRLYGVAEEKITVIHHGYGGRTLPEGVAGTGNYVLFVGKRGGYKNFSWFVRELAPLMREQPELRLVCTGGGFDAGERKLLDDLGMLDRAEARFVDDGELRQLYAQAACFVYPSRYEGFGIPILEAFAARCPVVLSEASCFPEVGGDAALYFRLDDGEGLRRAVRAATGGRRDKLVAKGLERVKGFTWNACAEKTMTVYAEAMTAPEEDA